MILPPDQWVRTALKKLPAAGYLDWEALFGRRAPRVLDLGCGNGRFVVSSAVRRPEVDHLGVDALPVVIFVTAYDEHALRAFEVNAVDYLLKPYDDARFAAALQRAKTQARRRQADHVGSRITQLLDFLERGGGQTEPVLEKPGERILLKSSGEIFFLKAEEIDWIEAEGDYMKFHVAGRAHLMRETMARLEARLDPRRFIRIHRSTIVNIDRLRKLSPSFAGEYAVVLHDGTKLKLSRGYHDRLQELLKSAL